jgi:hypothetical protein
LSIAGRIVGKKIFKSRYLHPCRILAEQRVDEILKHLFAFTFKNCSDMLVGAEEAIIVSQKLGAAQENAKRGTEG